MSHKKINYLHNDLPLTMRTKSKKAAYSMDQEEIKEKLPPPEKIALRTTEMISNPELEAWKAKIQQEKAHMIGVGPVSASSITKNSTKGKIFKTTGRTEIKRKRLQLNESDYRRLIIRQDKMLDNQFEFYQ